MTDEHYPPYSDADAPDNVTPLHTHAQNLDAEQALIGAILLQPEQAGHLLDLVDPDDFYDPRHETIWHAIADVVHNQGLLPDHILVTEQLRNTGQLTATATLLPQLLTACPSPAQADHYAHLVHQAAIARRASTELAKAQQQIARTTPENLPLHLGDALQTLDDIVRGLAGATTTVGSHTDLSWLLTGRAPENPPPVWIRRADGHATFYAGRVNGIFGDPETAKSWLAHVGVVEALTNGQRAAIIDVDHNGPDLTTGRLMLLGATREQLANPDLFRYHQPDDGPELETTITRLAAWQPAYVVLDSIGEMMPMLGIKSVDNDELSGALRNTATKLANTGACVVTIDHLPKNSETRASGYAIGGTAKKRAIDGAYLHAEAKLTPAPGQVGKITLRIEKDRPGRLREHATGKYLGTFTLDSRTDGITTISIDNDSPITEQGVFRPTGVMETVSRFVEDNDQCTFRDIKGTLTAKDSTLRAAIRALIDEGFMTTLPGPRNSTRHHMIALYREAEDDRA